jgi:pimeloyl-ACP methyl ester carboxylesterase
MLTTTSADGTSVRAFDEGRGPVILVLHGGMDDGQSWSNVAARLSRRFRVVRLHRRQYRLDITTGSPCSIAQEVDHVLAVPKLIDQPALVVGHSSGGVVALEAMAASPSSFAGAVLYEPPVVIGPPLGGEALGRARAELAAGRPGRAMAIFLRDIVRVPPLFAWMAGVFVAIRPRWRAFVPCQLDDAEAIDQLGVRLDAYARIEVPTVLLGGDRSPAHLGERLDALQRVMPCCERVVMRGRGHDAHLRAPDELARIIMDRAGKVLTAPARPRYSPTTSGSISPASGGRDRAGW